MNLIQFREDLSPESQPLSFLFGLPLAPKGSLQTEPQNCEKQIVETSDPGCLKDKVAGKDQDVDQ